jgi:tetratricopeptide (TPR) repeat protein
MISKTFGKANLLLLTALVFFGCALFFHVRSVKPEIVVTKQDSAFNLNQHFIKFFSFGNKRMISDIIWIQTLLESDMEKYTNRDLGNWLYLRFLTISELDPQFYENYQYGGMLLSIMKDDLEGAADIYEKGLKIFPGDYKLNYQAGFNYYYEMGDFEKGLPLFKKVENHPDANPMVKFLIRKIQFETDRNFDIPIGFLEITLTNTKDPELKKKIISDLYSLRVERDLECLNGGKKECSERDPEGHYYQLKDKKWVAPREYLPYRIYRRDFTRKR